MILADTFVSLLSAIGVTVTRTQSLLGVTGLVLLPLCLMKNLSSLAPFSLVGILGILYTTVAMAIRYFGGTYKLGGKFAATALAAPSFGSKGASAVLTPQSLILMCMLSNAYIAHFNAPTFYRELKNNTLPRFYQVIGWSFGAAILIYSLVTGLGFLTFGAASNGLILNNYSNKDLLMSLSRVAVAVSIMCRYVPYMSVPVKTSLCVCECMICVCMCNGTHTYTCVLSYWWSWTATTQTDCGVHFPPFSHTVLYVELVSSCHALYIDTHKHTSIYIHTHTATPSSLSVPVMASWISSRSRIVVLQCSTASRSVCWQSLPSLPPS